MGIEGGGVNNMLAPNQGRVPKFVSVEEVEGASAVFIANSSEEIIRRSKDGKNQQINELLFVFSLLSIHF